jgi:hypothetical protein
LRFGAIKNGLKGIVIKVRSNSCRFWKDEGGGMKDEHGDHSSGSGCGCVGSGGGDSVGEPGQFDVVEPLLWGFCVTRLCTRKALTGSKYCQKCTDRIAKKRAKKAK